MLLSANHGASSGRFTARYFCTTTRNSNQKQFLEYRAGQYSSKIWARLIDREVRPPFVLQAKFTLGRAYSTMYVSQTHGMPGDTRWILASVFHVNMVAGAREAVRALTQVVDELNKSPLHLQDYEWPGWPEQFVVSSPVPCPLALCDSADLSSSSKSTGGRRCHAPALEVVRVVSDDIDEMRRGEERGEVEMKSDGVRKFPRLATGKIDSTTQHEGNETQ